MRSSIVLAVPADADAGVLASCDEGDIATGGGFSTTGEPGALRIYEARPTDPSEVVTEDGTEAPSVPSSYWVRAVNDTSTEAGLQAWVICLDLPDG